MTASRMRHQHRMDSDVISSATFVVRMMLLTALLMSTGCRSLRPSDGEGFFAYRDLLSTDNIRGPLERAFQGEENALERGEKFSPEALSQLDRARQLFDDQKYDRAIKAYDKIAYKYPESSIGEEAWFKMGEANFALKRYPKAQDCYDKLFQDYPSTKYVARASERLFSIAKVWLEVSDPVAKSAIKTVSSQTELDEELAAEAPEPALSARYSLLPNFFDKTRPALDTRGRAREALKSVWLNDPTGPLADDALMLTATYHLRKGDHLEADRYFQIIREEYPDSPHLEDAFVLGGHVKQISYQGPYYDGEALTTAEKLKERTLRMFPDTKDRDQIREDLKRNYLLQAQRAWADVELWKRKANPRAVAIKSMQLINEYPDTRYADQARAELLAINPSVVQDLPGVPDFIASLPEAPVNGPALNSAPDTNTGPPANENPVQGVSADATPEAPRRRWFGLLGG